MEERPKNVRKPAAKGKGFYIAMYASLGGLLLLALVIGYFNFIGPGATMGEAEGQQTLAGNLFEHGEVDYWPVGAQWDAPVASPQQQPQPQQPPAQPPVDDETGATQAPRPTPRPADTREEQEEPTPSQPATPQEDDDETTQMDDAQPDVGVEGANIYNVFEPPAPSFAYFSEGDNMHWPVLGEVVMDFAMDRLVFDPTLDQWRTNDKMAISADRGDAVRSAAAGRVHEIAETRQFGQKVVIDHGNGWFTTYSQLDPDVVVNVGDVVSRGQIIGAVGSPSIFTSRIGYHVGFRVSMNDVPIDPNTLLTTVD